MKAILIVAFTFSFLCSCTTTRETQIQPFNSNFSTADLEFALRHLAKFIDSHRPTNDSHAKQHILKLGGIVGRPLSAKLPDDSLIQVKVSPDNSLFISGHQSPNELWIVFIQKKKDYYYLTVAPLPNRHVSASFAVFRDGRVSDDGIVLSCP